MLTVEEALARCLRAAKPVIPEAVAVGQAAGRVLAADLVAPLPLPPWANSAMDGFAVRSADLPAPAAARHCDAEPALDEGVALTVLETIAAGKVGQHALRPGTCAAIMTGAPLPEGADAVIMREDAEELCTAPHRRVRLRGGARPGQHVRAAGDDLPAGAVVLRAGTPLSAAALGLAAALGQATLTVARQPRVAILATGDEVIPPGQPLGPGQIWSSNSVALAALVAEAGGLPLDCGIAPDTLEGTRAAFRRALEADFILSTGGVSVGDFDVVKAALSAEGADLDFWKVRMKPGKPLAFGSIGGRPAFGLPGNPVSCVVNFYQFVRPVLRRSLGDPRPFLPVVQARLSGALQRSTGREELVRVALALEEGALVARPLQAQGSAQISGLVAAQGLMLVARDRAAISDGETVSVQVIDAAGLLGGAAEPGYRW